MNVPLPSELVTLVLDDLPHGPLSQQRLDELKREIVVGLEQLSRGELIRGEQVFAELRLVSEERRSQRA
jgi:hypothetical protein